jgi:CheY-like chemotaxis protein
MADTLRVLYVDDEHSLPEIGRLFPEETGDLSVTTIDSASARSLIRKENFDVIISNCQIPGLEGITT